jgi:hypothetical protein
MKLAASVMPVSCLAYSSTLKIQVTSFSEISVDFRRTTRRYIPEDITLHFHFDGFVIGTAIGTSNPKLKCLGTFALTFNVLEFLELNA